MPVRIAEAEWEGSLAQGRGRMQHGSCSGAFTLQARLANNGGANPEELIAAALAGCYSMALAAELGRHGHSPNHIQSRAAVDFGKHGDNYEISHIILHSEVDVPGVVESKFQDIAKDAKSHCPVARALRGTDIHLEAKLLPSTPSRMTA